MMKRRFIVRLGFGMAGVCAAAAPSASAQLLESLLATPSGDPNDHFGAAVATSGDVVVVGAFCHDDPAPDAGAAYVFHRLGCGWVEAQRLVSLIGRSNDWMGASVAVSGNIIAVGAPQDSRDHFFAGSVTVYERSGDVWQERGRLRALDQEINALFGFSVAVADGRVIVGAPLHSTLGLNAGAVYIFQKVGQSWAQVDKLTAPDGGADDAFGASVAAGPGVIVIGAIGVDDVRTNAGGAYVFDREPGFWIMRSKIWPLTGGVGDNFGTSVAYSNGTVVVGSPFDDTRGEDAGAVYVFKRPASIWITDVKLFGADIGAGDHFGASVAVNGDTILAGAPKAGALGDLSGAAYTFARETGVWSQSGKVTPADGAEGDEFGAAVAITPQTMLVGAVYANAQGKNSGAAYTFADRPCPPDTNCDGAVNAADLGLVLGAWGPLGAPAAVDINGDGAVTAADLGLLLGGWGTCP